MTTAFFRSICLALAAMGFLLLTGCNTTALLPPVPAELVDHAQPRGLAGCRAWGDQVDESFTNSLLAAAAQQTAYHRANPSLPRPATLNILAISGGGEDGAYGAGLLCGWSKAGTRPQFELVTGVSTGALIAPFAFLGPDYDPALRDNYTKVSGKDIFIVRGFSALFNDNAMLDSKPLRQRVEASITPQVLRAIALEHSHGRRLLIGTTNFDAQRPVIWDMGAIASSNDPAALQLFQDVMIASASIPAVFPPVYIPVTADGKQFSEMHVDGGAITQLFLWGPGMSRTIAQERLGETYAGRPARLYVLRNGRVNPGRDRVQDRVLPIAGRAIATLLKANGANDMYRLYQLAQDNQLEFHLAYIPEDFTQWPSEPFDTQYMTTLFDLAYHRAATGYPWSDKPPIVR